MLHILKELVRRFQVTLQITMTENAKVPRWGLSGSSVDFTCSSIFIITKAYRCYKCTV